MSSSPHDPIEPAEDQAENQAENRAENCAPAEVAAPNHDPPNASAIAVSPDALTEQFAWSELFADTTRPLELEIGSGKGTFLLNRAKACPTHNLLGIEWANEYYRYTLDRLTRWQIDNARILRTDGAYFVRVICPRDSLHVLHVYHPDPWPKKRHHKRRLIQQRFVDAAVACLIEGGRWAVQTDHAEYFEQIQTLLRAHPHLEEVDFDDPAFGVSDASVQTNFELKYRAEGRSIHQIALVKRATSR